MEQAVAFTEDLLQACRSLGQARVVLRNPVGVVEVFADLERIELRDGWAHLCAEPFHVHLHCHAIAQVSFREPDERDGARMLVLGRHATEHALVRELADRIEPGSLVVLNETRVRRARLQCRRPKLSESAGGGRAELLLLEHAADGSWRALGRANKPLRDGDRLEASALGEPIDAERHAPATEAKGATLTALRVAPDAGGWMAQCVVDV